MDIQNRSLNDVIGNVGPTSEQQQQGQREFQSQDTTNAHSTYVKIFSRLLSQRFNPDTTDLSEIPYESIKKLSYFAYGAAKVASETWQEINLSETSQQRRQQRTLARGSRAA